MGKLRNKKLIFDELCMCIDNMFSGTEKIESYGTENIISFNSIRSDD